MKRIRSYIWSFLGAMLLVAALLLIVYNLNEDLEGHDNSERILSELREKIPEIEIEPTFPTMPDFFDGEDLFSEYETEPEPEPEEALIEVDGMMYLGIITIPDLYLELPVLSEWSYPNLKLSPCRYKGSTLSGDLIIAAHNYRSHFGRIQELNSGDQLYFLDASGIVHEYTVMQTEMVAGRNVEAMEFGSADSWDLTLFTCTISGQSRVTVRAMEIVEDSNP